MTRFAKIMAAAALAGLFAAPAVAQPYPGTYPGQPYGSYPGQPYGGYGGGYGSQGVIGTIIDGLIGNRYAVSDRQAVRQCAYAAVQRAESQYRPYFNGQPYAYQGYSGYVRVTAITDVGAGQTGGFGCAACSIPRAAATAAVAMAAGPTSASAATSITAAGSITSISTRTAGGAVTSAARR